MRLPLAIATLALLAATASTQAASLSGMGANLFGSSFFNFAKPNIEKAPVAAIDVGGLKVKLQSTRLVDVQKRFGGTIQSSGDATWLCYSTGEANTWFMSNALGGQEFVMMVAVEASARMPADCEAASEKFKLPEFGIPGLGAATADLKATFGAASGSKIAYRNDRPGGYSDTAQYIGYVLKSGKVTAIGVGETSVPTQH
jgi:hypothetical protein